MGKTKRRHKYAVASDLDYTKKWQKSQYRFKKSPPFGGDSLQAMILLLFTQRFNNLIVWDCARECAFTDNQVWCTTDFELLRQITNVL